MCACLAGPLASATGMPPVPSRWCPLLISPLSGAAAAAVLCCRCCCRDWDCHPTGNVASYTWGLGGLMCASAVTFLLMMWLALSQLGQRPYYEYRVQVRPRSLRP